MTPSSPLDRREFLRRGLGASALVTGIIAAGFTLTNDDAISSAAVKSKTAHAEQRQPSSKEWQSLRNALSGTLVLPGDPSYPIDSLLYNSKFAKLHPAAIAYCATHDDVSRCVEFTALHSLSVAARSGGHSYGGYSSCAGLVVDVSRLNTIAVNTKSNVATVGAGARLIDVYNEIGMRDRLLPGGSCPSVGIAGLTLGGGIGVFGRKFGLTCDNLSSAEVVTASGKKLTANQSDHDDLLWACRGGGGGNFGIATSFEFTVHPMPPVSLFTLRYPWDSAADVLEAWQYWITTLPDELWSNCQLLTQGANGFLLQVSGVLCGTPDQLTSLLAPLHASIGSAPSATFIGTNEYMQAMMIEAGCSGLTVASCHLDTVNPQGTLSREAYSAKSSYLDAPSSSDHATLLVQAVEMLHSDAPNVGGGLAFDAYGGAINRVRANETAFVHRDKLACIQATYSWSPYTSQSEIDAGRRWLAWLQSDVFNASTGAYQNYIDPTLADWRTAYYGGNLDRLAKIKRRYDPHDHFSFAQSIPRHL